MSFLESCARLDPGLDVLVCLNAEAQYAPVMIIMFLLFLLLLAALNQEPTKIRLSASLFATSIVGMMLGVAGLLPANAPVIGSFIVAAVGSIAYLAIRKES